MKEIYDQRTQVCLILFFNIKHYINITSMLFFLSIRFFDFDISLNITNIYYTNSFDGNVSHAKCNRFNQTEKKKKEFLFFL